jgi:SAM-dependent methyltransferase
LAVTGVDANPDLLATARERHPGCRFEQQDLRQLRFPAGGFDGLWCSFTAAYFVEFAAVCSQWAALLKPAAWVCVIDIDDLFGHEPLSAATGARMEAFYEHALAQGRYDFRAGRRLAAAVRSLGFTVQEFELGDDELAFAGPGRPEVLAAWRQRLARMPGLQRHLGAEFAAFQSELLGCLASPDHHSRCRVLGCVGTRVRA